MLTETFPKSSRLASNEELQELKEDAAVNCLGFAHEGKKTAADHPFEPQCFQGSIFLMPASEDLPGRPRLLHIEAKIPQNLYGSPILDENGNVLAVYGEAAPPADRDASPAGAAIGDMHYASLVVPDAIRQWTEMRNEKLWLSPAAARAFSQPPPVDASDHACKGLGRNNMSNGSFGRKRCELLFRGPRPRNGGQ